MDKIMLSWILFSIYLAVTFYLAYLGHKQTKSFADFAVGSRDMSPSVAGLTLGACLASTATFVINPGFVYKYGLPALVAFTVPFFIGIFAGLALLGPGFRRFGDKALTLPLWVGQRYDSEGLRGWFAFVTLLNIFYIVLIVKGSALVMQASMGVDYSLAVSIVVLVVFGYVFFGGTYAHAYTNTAQGAIMLVVACIIFGQVLLDMGQVEPGKLKESLALKDPHYLSLLHPKSPFFRNYFEVLIAPFLMGFAVVSQPHLLIKSLYLKDSKDMTKFLVIGGGSFVVFSLVMFSGFAARIKYGAALGQDVAAAKWIGESFPTYLGAFVSVAILAAAMSTLDGLLVAVSAIVGADLVTQPAIEKFFKVKDDEDRNRLSMRGGQITIILLGGAAWIIALKPPALVAVFGMLGVYGMLCATVPAVLYGVLMQKAPSAKVMGFTSFLAIGLHFGLYFSGVTSYALANGKVISNPTLTACIGLMVATPLPILVELLSKSKKEVGHVARVMA